jgi:hypothetical protein
MNYQEYVVIFVDVLASKSITSFERKYEIHETFHQNLIDAQGRQNSQGLAHVIYERRIIGFSDCAYIFYYYKPGIEDARKNANRLLQVALYNTSIMLTRMMSKGFLVRGGVAVGDAYLDEKGFFGPAVECAYELESKKAKNPKVLISKEAAEGLFNEETLTLSDPEFIETNSILRTSAARTILEENGEYYLNIFNHLEMWGSLSYGDETIRFEDLIPEIYRQSTQLLQSENLDEKIALKHQWLLGYLSGLSCRLREGATTFSTTVDRIDLM